MSTAKSIARTVGLMGAGVGLAMYAVFGLLEGAMLGGTAGVLLAGSIYGPGTIEIYGGGLITRVIVGGGMLAGALIALIAFVVAGSALGVGLGYLIGLVVKGKEVHVPEETGGRDLGV